MAKDFLNFFTRFNLMDLHSVFLDNDFRNIEGLMEVTNEDLVEMGVKKLGLRKSFLGALKKLTEELQSLDSVSENALQSGVTSKDSTEVQQRSERTHINVTSELAEIPSNSSEPSTKAENQEIKPIHEPAVTETESNEGSLLSTKQNMSSTPQGFPEMTSKPGSFSTPRRSTATQKRKTLFSSEKQEGKGTQKLISSMLNISPSTYQYARRKGIKIYSDSEIRNAKGFEKFRLPFLNEICDRLAQDGLRKTEVIGAADFEWRLRKCDLITERARSTASPSVIKNVDRMNAALKKLKESAKVVQKARDSNKHVLAEHVEQDEVSAHLSELRKSQDAAVKALGRYQEAPKLVTNEDQEEIEIELSEDEINDAVQEVKRLKDVYEFDE